MSPGISSETPELRDLVLDSPCELFSGYEVALLSLEYRRQNSTFVKAMTVIDNSCIGFFRFENRHSEESSIPPTESNNSRAHEGALSNPSGITQ